MVKRVIYFILIIIWMSSIFKFSSQNGEESEALSDVFTNRVVGTFFKEKEGNELEKIHDSISFIIRKTAHFSFYFLGGLLIFGFLNTFNLRLRNKIIWTIIIGFIYAMSDEFHQSFVSGRWGQFRDVCIDTSGVILATLIRAKINQIVENRKINE